LAGASAPADQGLRLANREKTERRGRVFWLTASVAIAFLLIALLFMSIWRQPETVALQTDRPAAPAAPEALTAPPAQAAPAAQAGPAVPEPEPILLNFVQDRESHHYRVNKTAGRILIIAGLVANGYPDRRSFIRIKGALRDSRQEVVAERQAFAGNYLTEEELSDLPMPEILARLALKGGKDNANVNVPPGQAVPFMLVFDRLPDDLAAYVLEPVGSVPAGPGQGNPG
jgi:hypothetical protein